jgi:hypothetical protein
MNKKSLNGFAVANVSSITTGTLNVTSSLRINSSPIASTNFFQSQGIYSGYATVPIFSNLNYSGNFWKNFVEPTLPRNSRNVGISCNSLGVPILVSAVPTSGTSTLSCFQISLAGSVTALFTGQHLVNADNVDRTNIAEKSGHIVCSKDTFNTPVSINQGLPDCQICEHINCKKVFGVLSNEKQINPYTDDDGNTILDNEEAYFCRDIDDGRVRVNVLGDGAVWTVLNENETIEVGDYVCSSGVQGTAKKQASSEYIEKYTIAKAVGSLTAENVNGYPTKQVGEQTAYFLPVKYLM